MAGFSVGLSKDVEEKVRLFLARLEEAGIGVEAAFVYGSHAVGVAGADSDIDVVVVSADLAGDQLEDWMRLNRIASRIDVRMEVVGFRPERFLDENPLVWQVKRRAVRLV